MWKIEKLRETNVENLKKKISDKNDPQQGVATGAAPGVCPSLHPPCSERGGCGLIKDNFESKIQNYSFEGFAPGRDTFKTGEKKRLPL